MMNGLIRRVSRAWRERSILSLSDRHVELVEGYAFAQRAARASADSYDSLLGAHRSLASATAALATDKQRLGTALAEIAYLPNTVKIPNGTTRKAARIAREALVA